MQYHLPNNIIDHVKHHLNHVRQFDEGIHPWGIKNSSGKFTTKSAWMLGRSEKISDFFQNNLDAIFYL